MREIVGHVNLSWLKAVSPWGGAGWNCSAVCSAPSLGFCAPWCPGISVLDSWTPTRAFSSVRDCQGQCSVGSDGGKRRFRQLADVTTIAAVSRCRPTTRRKPDYEPVENTDEAQKKFGNVKAISSDMYFGRQAQADVSVWRASVWAPRAGSRQGPGRRASR